VENQGNQKKITCYFLSEVLVEECVEEGEERIPDVERLAGDPD
jgi:hypothetical protein